MATRGKADSTRATARLRVRPLTTANVIADHAALRGGSYTWVRTLLRTRSVSAREVLAHLATGGHLTAEELEALPARRIDGDIRRVLDHRAVADYARVLALQPGPPSQEERAIGLLALTLAVDDGAAMSDADVALYAQLLVKHRRRSELEAFLGREQLTGRVRAGILASLRADLANPFRGGTASEAEFLTLLSRVIAPAGAEVVTLRATGATPFDRLGSSASTTESGPLITVVTSAFNPDHALLVAARSMIGQTWQDWEMLVVDDASTDPSAPALLAEVERLDPRIRVIRKAVNGGTYRARNTALRQARGAFVTFLDSDDWAHPERLAAGVRPMLDRPGVIATRGHGMRVTEDLELTRPGYDAHFEAASSLMFRFPDVPARIGFFDTARKAADTEYIRRMEAAFGRGVLDLPGRALTLLRRTDDSLSAADFSSGWRHPSRWAYKQAYGAAHRAFAAGADPFREPDGASPYFGTHRWAKPGDPARPTTRHVDVVFAGDWRRYGGPQVSMMEEITALRAHGLRVGVMHLEAMRFRSRRDEPLCEPLQARLRAGEVELVFADDDTDIDLMVLRYPPILQFPPAVPGAVRPRRLLIMANQAPAEPDGSDQRYVPADVHRHATELFGTEPLWVPQGPTIRGILDGLLPADVVAPWDNPGIIDPDEWYTERRPLPADGLVVGRYSRDAAIKFPPTAEELLTGYGFGPETHVRFMGATTMVARLLEESEEARPTNWTVLDAHAVRAREFLAGLDVVLYLDNPDAHEAFGRVLLESAASGALVIASPKHKQTFGDALLYAEPADAVALVRQCVADPALVARQRELTRRRVSERWSRASFVEKILAELPATADDAPEPSSDPPVGEVVLRRTGGRRPVEVVSRTPELSVLQAPVPRVADAELSDVVAVVHTPEAARSAADLLTDVRAAHRPGELVSVTGWDLPAGVCAVVLHTDLGWRLRATPDWRAVADGDTCRLASAPSLR